MGTSVYTSLLIKDYKRRSGEIKALRKDLRELAKVTLKKERELAAIELLIKAREPGISIEDFNPVATYPKVTGLKWNQLTRLILTCLREANGQLVSSDTIKLYVIHEAGYEYMERGELMLIRRCVQKRLNGLAAAGKVIPHHSKTTGKPGVWSLASSK